MNDFGINQDFKNETSLLGQRNSQRWYSITNLAYDMMNSVIILQGNYLVYDIVYTSFQ